MCRVRLVAVGDICLQSASDECLFGNIERNFANKDILFGNLETILSSHGQKAEKAVLLHASPDKVVYLKNAGFDILNIANNHIMDLGAEGFNETLEVLNRNNLKIIGAGNQKFNQSYAIIEKNGMKIGFLGYCKSGDGGSGEGIFVNRIDKKKIVTDIKNLKSQSDSIVISLHWGIENVFYPSPEQIKLARNLIDAGAVLILGHHPHVMQGIERYKNGLIVYSLGNFQFRTTTERTKRSVILLVDITKDGVLKHELMPIKMNKEFIPCLMCSSERREMISFANKISRPIIEDKIDKNWWFEEIAREYLVGNMKSWIARIKKYGIRHLLQCAKWLISSFTVECYFGVLRRSLRKLKNAKKGFKIC